MFCAVSITPLFCLGFLGPIDPFPATPSTQKAADSNLHYAGGSWSMLARHCAS